MCKAVRGPAEAGCRNRSDIKIINQNLSGRAVLKAHRPELFLTPENRILPGCLQRMEQKIQKVFYYLVERAWYLL